MSRTKHCIGRIDDFPEGQLHETKIDDVPVLIVRYGRQVLALEARCPHYGAPLAKGRLCDGRVVCPWHCASFDMQTGKLLDPPALDGLATYPVQIEGDQVYVEWTGESGEGKVAPDVDPVREADQRLFAVVGAGGAGAAAAEALREAGFRGRVLLISDDQPPYDRPACSKQYLAGHSSDDQLPLRSPDFYRDKGIDCLARRVTSVDVTTRTIVFEKTSGVVADKILLATGAVPIPLNVSGDDLPGVFTLRTRGDSCAIGQQAADGRHAVVVGDGFIGMEVAASLAERDCQVTLVSRNRLPMANVFGDDVGQRLQRLHEHNGTRFRFQQEVRRFHGDAKLESVELDDGSRLPADLAVVGVGVRPNAEIVQMCPKNPDGSIDVDQYLRLNDNVYAAGDMACYPDRYARRRIRIEHWRVAQQQGRRAARNMLGPDLPYDGVPFFWTRQFGVSFTSAGYTDQWDDVILTGDLDELDFSAYYIKDDSIQAIAGTQTDRTIEFMEQMRTGRLPAPEQLADRAVTAMTES